MWTKNTGLKSVFKDFSCININIHQICLKKDINTYLEANDFPYTPQFVSLKSFMVTGSVYEDVDIYKAGHLGESHKYT